MATAAMRMRTVADLQKRLWGVLGERIRLHPLPGTATVQDVIDIEAREGRLCELIDGFLVEKTAGYSESILSAFLIWSLNEFVLPRNLGFVTGESTTIELFPALVRIPDAAFTSWDRLPGRRRPAEPVPQIVPDLVVEVLSESNTAAEMAAKRQDYFAAGVRLVWEIEPEVRTVAVYTSPTDVTNLGQTDTLDGGAALPGFTLPLQQLFGELDRQG